MEARSRCGAGKIDASGTKHVRSRAREIPAMGVARTVGPASLTPRGRVAFHAAARQIYLEEPHGSSGLWTRLGQLEPPALFVWGKHDGLVPMGFAAHVKDALPSARHLELDCGHVPQIERSAETHAAIAAFLREDT
jgi:pimeloyl-ACP methyl ester carboxylesterase